MCFSDDKREKVDLKKETFEKIEINFAKDENIQFDTKNNRWNPYIKKIGNNSVLPDIKKSKNPHNQEDIDNINKEIEEKDKKIADLKTKIENVNKKIETLKGIVKIDVGEQLYLQDLLKNIKKKSDEN